MLRRVFSCEEFPTCYLELIGSLLVICPAFGRWFPLCRTLYAVHERINPIMSNVKNVTNLEGRPPLESFRRVVDVLCAINFTESS